jgi:hypothetical protein
MALELYAVAPMSRLEAGGPEEIKQGVLSPG